MGNENNSWSNQIKIYNNELDLNELFTVLWKKKILIIFVTSFFALGSVLYSLSLTNIYKSEVLLSVDKGGSNNNTMGTLGGMAVSFGIVGPNQGNKSTIAIKTIQSRSFLKHLLTFDNILPSLIAAKSYDTEKKKIIFNSEIYNENSGEWIGSKPTYMEIYPDYLKHIVISEDKSNLLTISIEHISPVFAKEFLELIINEVNELLRSKDLREANDAIAFLQSEIPKASLISMKDALNELVLSQLEVQMMAKINSEYLLKVIEPAFIPELKIRPNRAKISILGTCFGGMLTIILILLHHYFVGRVELDSN